MSGDCHQECVNCYGEGEVIDLDKQLVTCPNCGGTGDEPQDVAESV